MSINKYVIKSYLTLLAVIIILSFFWGCNTIITDSDWNSNQPSIRGSGRIITLTKNYSDFSEIYLSHSFKAEIFQSDIYSVTIKIDDNIAEHLDAFQSNERLELGLDNGYNYNDITLEAKIGVPDVTTINLSGASSVELFGYDFSHSLNIYLSGASAVKGNISVGDILLDMSGASYINFTGAGRNLTLYGSGASNIELPNFPISDADINLSGASYSKVNVSNYLRVHLSGASVLYYTGDPTMGEISVDGVSKIVKF